MHSFSMHIFHSFVFAGFGVVVGNVKSIENAKDVVLNEFLLKINVQ